MAMSVEKFSGKIENAHKKPLSSYKDAQGNPLPASVDYETEYQKFGTIEDVRSAGKMPSDSDIVDFVNEAAKAAARAKKISETLDALGVKKPTLEDPQERLRKAYELLIKNGETPEAARVMASQFMKVDWE